MSITFLKNADVRGEIASTMKLRMIDFPFPYLATSFGLTNNAGKVFIAPLLLQRENAFDFRLGLPACGAFRSLEKP